MVLLSLVCETVLVTYDLLFHKNLTAPTIKSEVKIRKRIGRCQSSALFGDYRIDSLYVFSQSPCSFSQRFHFIQRSRLRM